MYSPFFSINKTNKKNLLLLLFVYRSILECQDSFIQKHLYEGEYISNQEKISYVYGHKKFNKLISYYYYTQIKKEENITVIEILILLINDGENEQEIIPQEKSLQSEFEWHSSLIYGQKEIKPKEIIKKESDQKDMLLFGKNHFRFGTVYSIIFKIENNIELKEELLFNLYQYDKSVKVCLNY